MRGLEGKKETEDSVSSDFEKNICETLDAEDLVHPFPVFSFSPPKYLSSSSTSTDLFSTTFHRSDSSETSRPPTPFECESKFTEYISNLESFRNNSASAFDPLDELADSNSPVNLEICDFFPPPSNPNITSSSTSYYPVVENSSENSSTFSSFIPSNTDFDAISFLRHNQDSNWFSTSSAQDQDPECRAFLSEKNSIQKENLRFSIQNFIAQVSDEIDKVEKYKKFVLNLISNIFSGSSSMSANSATNPLHSKPLSSSKDNSSVICVRYPFIDGYSVPPANLDDVYSNNRSNISRPPQKFSKQPKWTGKERDFLAKAIREQNQRILLDEAVQKSSLSSGNLPSTEIIASEIQKIKNMSQISLEMNLVGLDWEKISRLNLPGRSPFDCKLQWTNHDHPLINKTPFTSDESKALVRLAQENGERNWVWIAEKLQTNRTASQCFSFYQRNLNKTHVKSKWTEQEDQILRLAVSTFGDKNWQTVANCFDGRLGQQCLHRWQKVLNPNIKKGKWTVEEDEALMMAVKSVDSLNWFKIQQYVPGRTDVQCRERYCNILDPSLKQGPWSIDEDSKLKNLVQKYGASRWSQLCKEIPGRTDNQCWRRWRKLCEEQEETKPKKKVKKNI